MKAHYGTEKTIFTKIRRFLTPDIQWQSRLLVISAADLGQSRRDTNHQGIRVFL